MSTLDSKTSDPGIEVCRIYPNSTRKMQVTLAGMRGYQDPKINSQKMIFFVAPDIAYIFLRWYIVATQSRLPHGNNSRLASVRALNPHQRFDTSVAAAQPCRSVCTALDNIKADLVSICRLQLHLDAVELPLEPLFGARVDHLAPHPCCVRRPVSTVKANQTLQYCIIEKSSGLMNRWRNH